MKIVRLLFLLVLVAFVSCGTSDTKPDGEPQKSAPAKTEKKASSSSKNVKVSNDPDAFV